jgi:hypothetical protein
MSTKSRVNIGLVGCGYMGRAHSNAFAKVNQFFELDARPVLKAACARRRKVQSRLPRVQGDYAFAAASVGPGPTSAGDSRASSGALARLATGRPAVAWSRMIVAAS